MDAILQVRNLFKRFGGVKALDGVTLDVPYASITAMIGPNGAGKTTLLDCVTGLVKPDSGQVYFSGKDIVGKSFWRIARMGISRTFQFSRPFRNLTVWENVASVARIPCWQERAKRWLGMAGLSDLTSAYADELSYGQQRLLELVRAVVTGSRLVLLDEPAAGVFPAMREQIFSLIQALKSEQVSFLIVEHDVQLVREYADHIIVLDSGRKVAEGPPDAVLADDEIVATYIGSSSHSLDGSDGPRGS